MKYHPGTERIPLHKRKAYNAKCLAALCDKTSDLSLEEIYQQYTGVGGLHGLNYVDFGNYHDFAEAKKEIEQGQFFTSDALCKWVIDCIRPEEHHKIADLTFGKGSFFNQFYGEDRLYGCEIDSNSFAIARRLFPNAHLTLGDIRTYEPKTRFHQVVGNPPYNLNWSYKGRPMTSQTVYILKAADLLYPGGMLAVIVPETFLGEGTKKIEIKQIYSQFNHVVQVRLDPDAFAWLGVRNFPTKLLILQRKADALPDVIYSPELVREVNPQIVFRRYVEPVMAAFRKCAPEIQLQINRDSHRDDEKKRRETKLLYQIKAHPRTREQYEECRHLLEQYYTQQCPPDMRYNEWQEKRLHYKPVMEKITGVLRQQNKVEEDRVTLVKGKDKLYYKAYSPQVQAEADALNSQMAMRRITQLTSSGTQEDFEKCGIYRKLMERKQREYRHQVMPFDQMKEDPEIRR